MEEDSQSWKDRCNRYFTSLSENGDIKQNGHIANKRKHENTDDDKKGSDNTGLWEDLAALQIRSKENQVIKYIKNAVFKIDIHGSKLAAAKSSHNIELLVWGIIILAVLGFTVFLVVLQYNEYLDQKTSFQIKSIYSNRIRYDSSMSLSICNLNILRQSSLNAGIFEPLFSDSSHPNQGLQDNVTHVIKSILQSNGKLAELIRHEGNTLSENSVTKLLEQDIVVQELLKVSNQSVVSRLQSTGSATWFHDLLILNQSYVKNFGHQLEDMLVSCFIGRRECNDRECGPGSVAQWLVDLTGDLGPYSPTILKNTLRLIVQNFLHIDITPVTDVKFGNCFQLSTLLSSEPVQLILNAEADEYILGAAPSVGFKVFIHDTGTDINEGQTVDASVNHYTSVHVKKETIIQREDGSCVSKPGRKKRCQDTCHKSHIKEYCGCSLDTDDTVPLCKYEIMENLICQKVIALLQSRGHLDCDCKENCRDRIFETSRDTLEWPSPDYMPILSSMLSRKHINLTESQIRQNLAYIHVNVVPEVKIIQEESRPLRVLDLLAHFGGLFALVAGMSLFTLIEIVWIVAKTVFDLVVHVSKRSAKDKEIERLSDSQITSVTWAMYKQKRRQEELDKGLQMNNEQPTDRRKLQGSGLVGNVNSRLHRRNSYLSPISENGDLPTSQNERKGTPQRALSESNNIDIHNSSYNASHKYEIPKSFSDYRYKSNTSARDGKRYSETNGNVQYGISTVMQPYSGNVFYNNRNTSEYSERQYVTRNPLTTQHLDRGRYKKDGDQVHLYGNSSAYFHANTFSEPTFL